ncbi:O-antigen ligase family protein [Candidatus Amesbacteria bacterium]|nr:O-antigen ligase family protein [Candidatus Amesbacteria bacterium]
MNLLLIVAFLAGNLYKFSYVSPLDVIVGLMWIFMLPKILDRRNILLKSIIGFTIVGVISLFMALLKFEYAQVVIGAMYLLRWIVYASLAGVTIQSIKVLPIIGIGIAVLGISQYVFVPDLRFLEYWNWDPHYYRIVGTLLDPGFTGLILVLTLVFIVLNNYNKAWWLIVYIALALTYSRASYLAFFTAFTWISYQKQNWRYGVFSILILGLTILILPRYSSGEGVKLERTSTIWARVESWRKAWQIFSDNPIFGVGFNTYRYAQKASNDSHAGAGADSSLLLVLATTGIVGFLFYLKYLKSIWQLGMNNLLLSTSLVTIFVHSMFLNSLFYPAIMLWIALLIPKKP